MKIDTIRLQTKATLTSDSLQKMAESRDHITYHNRNQSNYTCYSYRIEDNPRLPLIRYTVESQKLEIVVPSLPRLVTGSCMIPLNDNHREEAYAALQRCVNELGIDAPPPPQWVVRGIDVYHDFQVGEGNVPDYQLAMSSLRIPRYKTINFNGETVQFMCGSKKFYTYNKHQKCIENGDTVEDIERSRGYLRFEVGYTAAELSKDGSIASVNFEEVCKDRVTQNLVERYFNMIPMSNLYVSTEGDMLSILTRQYGGANALKLIGFVRAYALGDLGGISQRTVYRNLELLHNVGIAPVIGTRRLAPLVLPFSEATVPSPFQHISARAPIYLRGQFDDSPLIPKHSSEHYNKMLARQIEDIRNLK